MPLETIQLSTVYVNDQEAALDYYTEKLGLEKQMDESFGGGQRFLVVAPPGESTGLVLHPRGEQGQPGGFTGIVFGSSDVEGTHSALAERGVEFTQPPERQEWGATMGMFKDPDGNVFVLHER